MLKIFEELSARLKSSKVLKQVLFEKFLLKNTVTRE